MTWLELIIGGLVTYRLALMFSKESGPGRIFRKLRNLPPPKSATKEGLSCLHCESIWWAVPVTVYYCYTERIELIDSWMFWLVFSAVAIVLHHAFTVKFKA